jgi:hypothetical protein
MELMMYRSHHKLMLNKTIVEHAFYGLQRLQLTGYMGCLPYTKRKTGKNDWTTKGQLSER